LAPGGPFAATNVPIRSLIRFAYQLQDFQIVGGPNWIGADRFDITANAEGDVKPSSPGTVGSVQLMMRTLLAERFKLTIRREQRELPVYALVLARADGTLGPHLKLSSAD